VARYEHLPIYKKAFDLFLYFEKIVRKLSRYDKYTLEADLRNYARSVLKLIVRAKSTADKRPVLEEIRSHGVLALTVSVLCPYDGYERTQKQLLESLVFLG